MASMTTMPRGREFTRADLDAMPDDGHRYELLDGALIVTPAPRIGHQAVLAELFLVVHAACPVELSVFFAPLDVRLGESTVLQPDLLVARTESFDEAGLPGAPLLAVEVLSPSTRHIDLGLKRSAYEAAGAASYWVVDPTVPSVRAWELQDGAYVEVGHVVGEDTLDLERPFPVSLVPARLVPGHPA